MLLACVLIIAAVLILPVALRFFAEPDNPGNGVCHQQEDGEPPDTAGDGPGDVLLAA